MKDIYPDFHIVPEKIKLSFGELVLQSEATAFFDAATGSINFTWKPEYAIDVSLQDQGVLLAYYVEIKKAEFITMGAFRKTGQDELRLPDDFAEKYAEVYMAFVATDPKQTISSIYLGSILCQG